MQIAMIGLGKMGANMARRLCRKGIKVIGYNRSQGIVNEIAQQEGMIPATSLAEAVDKLTSPRVVWLMLPSGDTTEQYIQDLIPLLNKGDVIVDGGNSNYHDSERRGAMLAEHNIGFADAGTSGGIWGLDNGYCLMVGGKREVVTLRDPWAPSALKARSRTSPDATNANRRRCSTQHCPCAVITIYQTSPYASRR